MKILKNLYLNHGLFKRNNDIDPTQFHFSLGMKNIYSVLPTPQRKKKNEKNPLDQPPIPPSKEDITRLNKNKNDSLCST
jgi:hypothetical protein